MQNQNASRRSRSNAATVTKSPSRKSPRPVAPATRARLAAGLTLDDVAKKLGISKRYVQHLETSGSAHLRMAAKMAKLYGCSGNLFLFTPAYFESRSPDGAATMPDVSVTSGAETSDVTCSRRR